MPYGEMSMQPKIKRIVVPKIHKILFMAALFLFVLGVTKIVLWSRSFMQTTGLTPGVMYRLLTDTGMDLPRHQEIGRAHV